MKIEEAPTKLDCERVTKGLIYFNRQLNSSMKIPLPRLYLRLFNVDMRFSRFVAPAVEDISSQHNGTEQNN